MGVGERTRKKETKRKRGEEVEESARWEERETVSPLNLSYTILLSLYS